MPDSLRLADGSYMRRQDVQSIIEFLLEMHSVEVIGFSNVGKSALLRLLAQRDVWTQELGEIGRGYFPVYVDCNRMLDLSDQGLYELILRCLQESNQDLSELAELRSAYESLVAPGSDFQVPLSFNQGLTAVLTASETRLVLLFDEFDEPFTNIHARVFLNLRALKDRYQQRLVYVTATGTPLISLRSEDHSDEFCELFSHRSWYLAPLTRPDQERFVRRYARAYESSFTTADIDFIGEWSGGHPRLLNTVCRILDRTIADDQGEDREPVERWELQRLAVRSLRNDPELLRECEKIWNGCNDAEQIELLNLSSTDHDGDPAVLQGLNRRHILLSIEGSYRPFSRLLAEYIQRKIVQSQSGSSSLWVDVDSGEVLVNRTPVDTLTNLEYRLMLLLFQNSNKIVDKYQIVTQVWGDNYIDEVDDARIEKLVSRLRQKIEQDTGNPQFLTTVRGRGYRLLVE